MTRSYTQVCACVCNAFRAKSSNCARDSCKRPLLPALQLRHAVAFLALLLLKRAQLRQSREQKEEMLVPVQPLAGGCAAGHTGEYPCKVTPPLQGGLMAHAVFCSVESLFAKLFLFFFFFAVGCISNKTEAHGAQHSAYRPAVAQDVPGRQL